MLARALIVWLLILILAIANGALRQALIVPRLGDLPGHAVSTIVLCALILMTTWLTIGWIGPRASGEAWRVGGVWLALTLAFEFLAGHYLFGNPWSRLLEDYNVVRGRIWPLVLVATLLAPRLAVHVRGLTAAAPPG